MSKGYVYILECSDGSYYTGSTIDIEKRITEHNDGKGANHTKKRLPVKLIYLEEFRRIDDAFYREKQIQGWSRVKKEALIKNKHETLPKLSLAHRDVASRASAAEKSKTYRSNGKLLITGEYVVLDGANALAIPTKYGQSLTIEKNLSNTISWKSYNELNEIWYEDHFTINDGEILKPVLNNNAISNRLIQILKAANSLNPEFLNSNQGYNIITNQDFNRFWGLGTSSTLINNIANWAKIDAYKLLQKTFGGSGYDIACAQHNTPLIFQLNNTDIPSVKPVNFNPKFKNKLYFVYLNKKQNSRDGIATYRKNVKIDASIIDEINAITDAVIAAQSISDFNKLLNKHEAIISSLVKQEPIKSLLFKDFRGTIKSLGAWGGDFVLATSELDPKPYFSSKGFETVIPYSKMVIN